jgi:hypothetical protein
MVASGVEREGGGVLPTEPRHGLGSATNQEITNRRAFATISFAHGGSLLAHKLPALGFLNRLPSRMRVPYPGDDLS